MVIWTSLQACGVVLPFAISTSICRSSVTICSGLYLLIDMTGLPPQVNSLSFHLVQKSPVRSDICPITLTLDSLDVFTSDLHRLRAAGVLQEGDLPWAVCLTDLWAIS